MPRPIPRPTAILAPDTFEAATRGVHFAASAAAFEDPEPARVRDIPLSELVRIQLSGVRQLVDQPFLREEIRRIQRRAQSADSQIADARGAVVEQPPVRNVVHVVLRQP